MGDSSAVIAEPDSGGQLKQAGLYLPADCWLTTRNFQLKCKLMSAVRRWPMWAIARP